MSEKTPNSEIDRALKKLLKECEGEIAPEKADSMKVKVEVLKAAMSWEKVKNNIKDKNDEGQEWGAPANE